MAPPDLPGDVTQRVDQQVDILSAQVPGPDIHEPPMELFFVPVGMEIGRRHAGDKVTHFVRVQRCVAQRQHAALANSEKVDRRNLVAIADHVDESVQIEIDKIAEVVVPVCVSWVAPIQDVHLATGLGEIAKKGTIFLKVEDGPAADHRVRDEYRGRNLRLLGGDDAVQRLAADAVDLLTWGRGKIDILVANLHQQSGRIRRPRREVCQLGDARQHAHAGAHALLPFRTGAVALFCFNARTSRRNPWTSRSRS